MPEGIQSSWSPAPGTTDAGQLASEICRYVMAPDDSECLDLAREYINDAIRRINTKRWCWSRTSDDVILTSATEYDLESNFKSERSAVTLSAAGGIMRILKYLQPRDYEKANWGNYAGSEIYTIFNAQNTGRIVLGGVPPGVTLRVRYYKRIAFLANASDRIDAPSEVESFVKWHAKSGVAATWDSSKYAVASKEAADQWLALIRDDARQEVTDW